MNYMVYTWFTYELYGVYIWFISGLHMNYKVYIYIYGLYLYMVYTQSIAPPQNTVVKSEPGIIDKRFIFFMDDIS